MKREFTELDRLGNIETNTAVIAIASIAIAVPLWLIIIVGGLWVMIHV